MQGLHVDHRFRHGLRPITEHPCRALKKLATPSLDLVEMEIEILHQFNQGLRALDRATAPFALNAWLWFRRARLATAFSSLAASCYRCPEKSTYPGCSDSRNRQPQEAFYETRCLAKGGRIKHQKRETCHLPHSQYVA